MTTQLEKYHADGRANWRSLMLATLGALPPARAEWTDINDIVAVLSNFVGAEKGHTYFADGGGQTMKRVSKGREPGTIELSEGKRSAYVFKVESLAINYFAQAAGQSFIYLHCGKLAPTGIYDRRLSTGFEEVAELSPGDFRPRSVWDERIIGHSEDGDEIPLPEAARLTMRSLTGDVLMAGNGSLWNNGATYDGEHDRLGEDGVRQLIVRAINEMGLTE